VAVLAVLDEVSPAASETGTGFNEVKSNRKRERGSESGSRAGSRAIVNSSSVEWIVSPSFQNFHGKAEVFCAATQNQGTTALPESRGNWTHLTKPWRHTSNELV
jgi:hypothetical protein